MIDPDVVRILRAVPEFAERYLDLLEHADGDPGAAAAFAELADFASELATGVDRHRLVLGQLMAAVEEVAASSRRAEEHIGWAFLDSLSPDETARLRPWLGPSTRSLADLLESGSDGDAAG